MALAGQDGQRQVQMYGRTKRLGKSRAARSAYLNHIWLLRHLVKMLLLQGTGAKVEKPPLNTLSLESGKQLLHERS